jgi:hypothetical protein
MTLLSEQLSAVRQSQWEAQLDMLRTLSTRVLDSTEQLIALNMKTSRTSMEQATGTFKQLLEVTNPRDLYALGSVAQGQWQHMFAYSRELLGIATGVRALGWSALPAARPVPAAPLLLSSNVAPAPAQTAQQAAGAATIDTALETALDTNLALAEATLQAGIEDLHEAAAVPAPDGADVTELDAETAGAAPSETPSETPADTPADTPAAAPSEPAPARQQAADGSAAAIEITVPPETMVDALVDQALIDETPPAKVKPLAKALKEMTTQLAGAEHPVAATVPLQNDGDVVLPLVEPVDNTPPPQPLAHAAPEPRSRASRKK